MRLESILFGGMSSYKRMARVFAYSVEKNSPKTPLTIHHLQSDEKKYLKYGNQKKHSRISNPYVKSNYVNNTMKTIGHNRIVQSIPDDEVVALMDSDMLVLHDLSSIEDMVFDLIYTTRPPGSKFPINSGVIFLRGSQRVRDWYSAWESKVREFVADRNWLKQEHKYGGINQSALGWMLEQEHKLNIQTLPCSIWNCENESWKLFSDKTKIVHVLGGLRSHVCHNHPVVAPEVKPLAAIWKKYERLAYV